MIDLKRYRIIDLTAEVRPGILKVDGVYMHGKEPRKFELRQFIFELDKTFMHWIDAESHIGTHVEAPSHYIKDGKSVAELPLKTFMGEALVLKFENLKPIDGRGQPIKPTRLEKVRKGDIVLMWSPYEGGESPYISPEASAWLAERGIKMLGVQNIGVEAPNSMATHDSLLRNDIPIIEGLVNLDKIRRERVFYIGLPLKVYGLDSSWIRAIALEEI